VTSSRLPRIPVFLVAALLGLVARPAAGQGAPPAPTDAAKVHYERATAAYGLGNYAEAALAYEKAFELKPDPALLYNAAQAHRRAGNRPRAIELYRSFLQVFPRAENREVAERHLAELERASGTETASAPPPALPSAVATPADPSALPPSALAPPPAPDPAASVSAGAQPALWRRPWFWIVVGAGAVVAGTVTALALSGTEYPRPSWGRVGP
jgi:tetratricopeptide (TPR) repeat protein